MPKFGGKRFSWKEIEEERRKITKWNCMVEKLKKQFILVDYELDLFKKMQGLKQAGKSV